jgi:hypothetical protein
MLYSTRSPFVPKSEQREIIIVLIVLAVVAGIAYFRANQPSGSDLFGRAPSAPAATKPQPSLLGS